MTGILREIEEAVSSSGQTPCPVRDVLDRIGDKWSVHVMLRLASKPEGFNSLLRSVSGISQRMLTVTLRSLERDGLASRSVFDTRPPTTEYRLTPIGSSLISHLAAIAQWAVSNADAVEKNRQAFDDRNGAPSTFEKRSA
ncbi:transcriptional regulator [Roseibium hamelinense]|nr:transcriptional regulator [Roseibium hamelinense]